MDSLKYTHIHTVVKRFKLIEECEAHSSTPTQKSFDKSANLSSRNAEKSPKIVLLHFSYREKVTWNN